MKHQHATKSTEELPKKQKISEFRIQIKIFNLYMNFGDLKKEKIFGMTQKNDFGTLTLISKIWDLEKQQQNKLMILLKTKRKQTNTTRSQTVQDDDEVQMVDRQAKQEYYCSLTDFLQIQQYSRSIKQRILLNTKNNDPFRKSEEKIQGIEQKAKLVRHLQAVLYQYKLNSQQAAHKKIQNQKDNKIQNSQQDLTLLEKNYLRGRLENKFKDNI